MSRVRQARNTLPNLNLSLRHDPNLPRADCFVMSRLFTIGMHDLQAMCTGSILSRLKHGALVIVILTGGVIVGLLLLLLQFLCQFLIQRHLIVPPTRRRLLQGHLNLGQGINERDELWIGLKVVAAVFARHGDGHAAV